MKEFFETLPESWQLVTLEEVCWKITDGTHKTPRYVENGVRFISIKNIRAFTPINWEAYERFISREEHEELTQRCKPEYDDILFPRIGTLGFAKRIDFKEEVSIFVGLGLAKPIKTIIQPKYLEYWMNHPVIHDLSHDRANGTGRLTLPLAESKKLPVPLAPFKEQSRIVEKLEELLSDLDDGVAELKAAQTKLTQYRQSLLKSAVEGSLTAEWRARNKSTETGEQLLKRILAERRKRWEKQKLAEFEEKGQKPPKEWQKKYPEPVAPDTSELPELPEGWVWATIDQLAWKKRYGTSSKTDDDSSGIPVLRMGNLQEGAIDYKSLKYLPKDHREFPDLLLSDGDLLFNRTNSAELVGKTAIYRDIGKPCSFASYLISVSFCDFYLPDLAAYFINSTYGKAWLPKVINQTAGQANVNGTKLGELAIPVPPRGEQAEIAKRVRFSQAKISEQANSISFELQAAEAQRKNILMDAFRGKLVPQYIAEQSAVVLLEGIRMKRAEKMQENRQKKRLVKSVDKNKYDLGHLKDWLASLDRDQFTFSEIAGAVIADYDDLRSVIFLALSESQPLIYQHFDERSQQIIFKKTIL